MKCDPPPSCQLIAPIETLDFLDCRCARCPSNLSALALYRHATARSPRALGAAFAIRDRISGWFGVEPIGGFDKDRAVTDPGPGDYLHFFRIEAISEQQLVLTAKDVHLETLLCVDIEASSSDRSTCYITSSVVTKNVFGRAYMVPVALAHGMIVEWLLRGVSDL